MKEETTENISFLCSFPGYFNFAVNYVNAQALLKTVKLVNKQWITDSIHVLHKLKHWSS